MQTIKKAALVLVGILLGCGGAAVAPMAISSAQTPGQWACFDTAYIPDAPKAAEEGQAMTQMLNAGAKGAAAGTVITPSADAPLRHYVCVKN